LLLKILYWIKHKIPFSFHEGTCTSSMIWHIPGQITDINIYPCCVLQKEDKTTISDVCKECNTKLVLTGTIRKHSKEYFKVHCLHTVWKDEKE